MKEFLNSGIGQGLLIFAVPIIFALVVIPAHKLAMKYAPSWAKAIDVIVGIWIVLMAFGVFSMWFGSN